MRQGRATFDQPLPRELSALWPAKSTASTGHTRLPPGFPRSTRYCLPHTHWPSPSGSSSSNNLCPQSGQACTVRILTAAFRFGRAASGGCTRPTSAGNRSARTSQRASSRGTGPGLSPGIGAPARSRRCRGSGVSFSGTGWLPRSRLTASQCRFFRASAQNLAGCDGFWSIRRPRRLRSAASWSRWGGVQVEQQQLGISHGGQSPGGRTARRWSAHLPAGRPAPAIIEHRAAGLSWAKVADKLNATGHRTRTGGQWTRQGAHQVHRVQERAAA